MSSRKSKSGAGKATKKSIQPARRDLGAHPPTKNPSTSGRNKSKNDKGMLAPDVAHVKGEGTIEARSAITIQCAFRQYLARKERARRLREKKEFEEQMEKLEREAFIALVRREQEAAAREREKEEVERRRRQEEQKRRYRMLEAAFEGDVEEIQSILKEVSELDTKDGVAFDEIGQVLRRRHQLDMVDCTDAHGNTPLSEAAGGGHPSAIKFLIEKGANPNSKGVYGRTPLYRAAFGGHVAAVQTLLQSGADPRISAEDGTMPVEDPEPGFRTDEGTVPVSARAAESILRTPQTHQRARQVCEQGHGQDQHHTAGCPRCRGTAGSEEIRSGRGRAETLTGQAAAEGEASERWPLIIDPSGQASTFLRYRDTNFHNALNPSHMKPEVLRLGLLGAIRYGKMLVIDMMEVNMFQVVTAVFEQIQAGLMERLLSKELLQKDGFLSLIQPGDGPEYSRNEFSPSRVEKFQLVLLTKQQTLAKELLSVFYPIQIIIQ
ncbi:IQ motif and ankyrin repeat domain-containing protein 1-like isoform X4 [Hypanus sabinus]|uniref:IQ motif and ankyrin repeat domain-containing protein 1-like isoform X4 n=1 Tax=Hypanus sabinus TaxID=79690 RepID=UPI0028C4DA86|nr:IQ motif and ankyrin repeat domain-containing protein 1-like isoform X4 [Hypanus sabinus]